MSKREVKKKKEKFQTTATIDKRLARALSLTKSLQDTKSYVMSKVYYDKEKRELVSTDGRIILIVKLKESGSLFSLKINTGLYRVAGDLLIRAEEEEQRQEKCFPRYENVTIKSNPVCHGDLLYSLLDCIIKRQVKVDIWKYENVLKVLDKMSSYWSFTNESPSSVVMMETSTNKFDIVFMIMPIAI